MARRAGIANGLLRVVAATALVASSVVWTAEPAAATTAPSIVASSLIDGRPGNVTSIDISTNGAAEDDLMLVHIVRDNTDNAVPPADWTLLRRDNLTYTYQSIYWKIAGASEPATYSWSFTDVDSDTVIWSARIDGVDTTIPIGANDLTTTIGADDMIAPSVAATTTDSLLLSLFAGDTGGVGYGPPGGMTERADRQRVFVALYAASETIASTSPTGTRTATADNPTAHDSMGVSLIVNPAAGSFIVNSTADQIDNNVGDGSCDTGDTVGPDPECTLRAAVQEANASAVDEITLQAEGYVLEVAGGGEDNATTGDLDVTSDLTITGAGAASTTVDADSLDRIFEVHSAATLNMSDMTLTGGVSTGDGGAIRINSGTSATLTSMVLSGNDASASGVSGGAISNNLGDLTMDQVRVTTNIADNRAALINLGTATITNSLFDNNTAGNGGAIFTGGNGSNLTMVNVTLSGNTASFGGGLYNSKLATLTNVTITNNTGTGGGGGIYRVGGATTNLSNTIVADNTGPNPDAFGPIDSQGYNIIGDTTGSNGWIGSDQQNVDPALQPLADNGGPTQTHAITGTSPAIDAGDDTACVGPDNNADQRGEPRPIDYEQDATGPFCDVGAYEAAVPAYFISGTVFEDIAGDVLNDGSIGDANNPGAVGATVRLYDGGSFLVGTETTDASGDYSFTGLGNDTYQVVVDSRTIPSAQDPTAALDDIWAEQTYGPIGAFCATGGGGTVALAAAGPCYGGFTGALSDNAPTIKMHQTVFTLADADVINVDFGFSFNVVTSTRGGDNTDDDGAGTSRTVQGSLRQFIQNANAISGANAMRFVPIVPVNDGTWWEVSVSEPLPTLTDPNTTVDGTAYDLSDGTTVRNTNAGFLGANAGGGVTVGVDGVVLPQVQAPELEIVGDQTAPTPPPHGLAIAADAVTVRKLAIYGFDYADVRVGPGGGLPFEDIVVEGNVIGGAAGSFTDPGAASRSQVHNLHIEDAVSGAPGSESRIRDNLIGFSFWTSVYLNAGTSGWIISGNEVRSPAPGGPSEDAVRLQYSPNSGHTVSGNLIADSPGTGIETFRSDGGHVISNNTITGWGSGLTETSAIRLFGTGSVVDRNIISGGPGPGVLIVGERPLTSPWPASTGNQITQNQFGGNDGIAIDLVESNDDTTNHRLGDGVTLTAGSDTTTGNNGLDAPVVTAAAVASVVGTACAGCQVEVYRAVAGTGDDSGGTDYGEGVEYLGVATADGVGDWSLSGITALSPGDEVSAIAIDGSNDTSEFGANVTVTGPIVVNSTGNLGDSILVDGVCDTGGTVGPDPECTLRAAIGHANANGGGDIHFDIPVGDSGHSGGVWTISPSGSALPPLAATITIDATTQTGWGPTPVVAVDGISAGLNTNGFEITGDDVEIRGLAIYRFTEHGIVVEVGASGALIAGNHVGTDASGLLDRGNGIKGIDLNIGSGPTTIGGIADADRNVISGNGNDGIIIFGSDSNTVINNYIGTTVTGNAPLANGADGINIASGSKSNIIGQVGLGNVLSGNDNDGIEIDGASPLNVIHGNTIGLGADGSTQVANGRHGVVLYDGVSDTEIGGTNPGEGNVISANTQAGIIIDGNGGVATTGNTIAGNSIGTDAGGTLDRGNGASGVDLFAGATGNNIGVAGAGNIISGNGGTGVHLLNAGTTGNVVRGNTIGLDATGTILSNGTEGVRIAQGASANTVGGAGAGQGNVISGNLFHGVEIHGVGTDDNVVEGNLIGTDPSGTAPRLNGREGVWIDGGPNGNTIGGTTPAERNVISGNNWRGVGINDSDGNFVTGNYIGTDRNGTAPLGNGVAGVLVMGGASGNIIGGSVGGAGNVISGNSGYGVEIDGSGTNSNTVAGNYIGTDESGTADVGNSTDGVAISGGAQLNKIGGIVVAARNIISGNNNDGVWITGSGTDSNAVQGNWIGFGSDGSAIGNSFHGVAVENNASNNLVGGPLATQANRIGHSAWDGVAIAGGTGTGNAVIGNSIVDNTGLGIDFENDGITPNDVIPGDGDTGPNGLLNYPEITSATESGGTITLTGVFDVPLGDYRLEFFRNPSGADLSGHGEGEVFAGSTPVSHTASAGDEPWGATFPGAAGDIITATITECTDASCTSFLSTSEFSAAVTVTSANTAPALDPIGAQSGDEGTLIGFTATASDSDVPADTLTFTVEDGAGSVPAGASITAGGVFTWTPTEAQGPGVYSFDVVVTDDGAGLLEDRETITVTVNEVNVAPVLDPVGAQSGDEGTLIGFTATASDSDAPANTLTFTLEDGAGSVPAGASITAGGVFTFTPSEAQGPGVYSFDVVVTDDGAGLLEDRETITVTVNEVNVVPVLDPVGAQAIDELALLFFTATATDPDVPVNSLTFTLEDGAGSVPAGASITAGGVFTFTPSEAQGPGVYSFDVVVADDGAGLLEDRETITVTVNEANVAPALDPVGAQSGDEGTLIGFTATASDSDVPANTLTFTLEDGAGSVPAGASITAGGVFTFTPTEAQGPGVYSFDVVVTDDGAGLLQDRETIAVTVNEANIAPALDPVGAQSGDEGTLIGFTATASDPDVPANTLTFTLEDGAGSVPAGASITAGGVFTFTPSEAQGPGVYSFDVVVTDDGSGLLEDRETITVTVNEVNVTPVLDPVGAQSGDEGTLIGFTATASDSDVPANTLTFTLEDGAGSVPAGASITAGGGFTFTPTEAQGPGVYSFDVVVTDDGAGLLEDRETITVTVNEANNAPVLDPVGAQSGDEGTLITFTATASDSDVPATGLTFTLEDGAGSVPAGASITVGGAFTFTPTEAQGPGVYSFDVVVTDDGTGLLEDRETVTVTVNEVNVAPVLDPVGAQSGDEGTLIGFTATASDSDFPANTLTFSLEDGAGSVPAGASITAGGVFSFTPTEAQGPGVYSFDVVVTDDGAGLLEDRETITVTVNEVNLAPVLDPVGAQSGDEGTLIGFTATASDSDVPANALTFTLEDGAGSVPAGASITAGGVFTFTPSEAQGPGVYSFDVVVTDDGTGLLEDRETITVTVSEANNAPVLDPVGAQSGDEGTLIGFTATASDSDVPVNTLTFTLEDGAGSVPAGASITAGGAFTWTPSEAQGPGVYSFDVVVTDDGAGLLEDRETITVTVNEVNVVPVLDPVGPQSGDEGTLIGFTATATDADVPGSVTFALEDGAGSVPAGAVITAGGVFTWTPTEAQGPGAYSFDVVVTDTTLLEDRETITVTVNEANNAPVLDPVGAQSGDEGTLIGFTATASDSDAPANGLTFTLEDGAGSVPAGAVITVGGAFTFTPTEAQGPGVYSFDVVVTDDGAGLLEDRESITVTVNEVNVAPVLDPVGAQSGDEGMLIGFTATASDSDVPVNTLTFTLEDGAGSVPAGASITAGGVFTFTPTEAQGPGVYSFDVVVTDDGTGLMEDRETITVTVNEVNVAPVLDPVGPQSGDEGTLITFTATASDSDVPSNALTFTLEDGAGSVPAGASITAGGAFAFTPTESQGAGLYSFDVVVTDDGAGFLVDREIITVTVNEVNVAPVLDPVGAQSGDEGSLITFTATASDSDVPANGLTFTLEDGAGSVPAGASTTAGGVFTWTPTEAQGPGVYSFDVVVTDDGTGLLEDRETITVTVNEANVTPVLDPVGPQSGDEGTLIGFTATATDADVPGSLTFTLEDGAGSVPAGASITAGGVFTFTPTEAQGPGVYSFEVVVTDNTLLEDRETITVTVNEANNAPVLDPVGAQSGDEGALIGFTATASDSDIPANTLTFTLEDGAGSVPTGASITAGGVFTFTPSEAQGPGVYSFDVVVTDDGAGLLEDRETITVTVNEVNVAPVLDPVGAQSGDEGTLITFTATASDSDVPANGLTFTLEDGAGSVPAGAVITAGGAFTWTPTEAQGPGVYSFDVVVTDDGAGLLQDRETITVTVNEVNIAPVLDPVGPQSGDEGTLISYAATASDSDVPANALTFTLENGAGSIPAGASITAGGAFTWIPAEAQGPGVYSFDVVVTDDGTGLLADRETITVTVNEVNTAPVADPIVDRSPNEGATVSLTATASDGDVPANGLVWSQDSGPGAVDVAGNYTWVTGETDGPGTYTVVLRVTDDGSPNLDDTVSFDITVAEVDTTPVLDPVGPRSGDEGTLIGFTATATDGDVPGSITFTLEDGAGSVPAGASITAGGAFTWTPTEAQGPGVYSFDVVVTDNTLLEDRETITVTVNEANMAPILNPLPNPTQSENTFISFMASASDGDLPANTLSYSLVGAPPGATINPTSGVFGWIPTEAQGPGVFVFDVVVTDDGVPNLTDTDSVTITVLEFNRDPVLDPVGAQSGDEGTLITFSATASDLDQPANLLTFTLEDGPGAVPPGASITAGGVFTWTPTEAQGPGVYTFDVVVTDDGTPIAEDRETIAVTVGEVNAAPSLDPVGPQAGDEGTAISFTATASDPDLPPEALTFTLDGAPAGAAITTGGVFSWIPSETQGPGVYVLDVVVTDDGAPNLEDRETITVTVAEVDTAPTLDPIGDRVVDEGALLTFAVTSSDPDVPNSRTFSLEDGPGAVPAGAAIDPLLGLFGWSPTEAQGPGVNTFDVVVTDNTGLQDRETIAVTVAEINEAPILDPVGDHPATELVPLAFSATASDPDDPTNTLTFSLSGEPAGAAITGGGAFSWTPAEAQGPGTFTFDVVVTDDGVPVLADSETITVTLGEVNAAPVLNPIGDRVVDEETLVAFAAIATDPDVPADTLTYSLIGAPAGASIDPAVGAFSWTPTEAQGPASYSFTFVVTDLLGASDSETITMSVAEVNQAPTIVDPGDQAEGERLPVNLTLVGADADEPSNTLTWSATVLPDGLSIDPVTGGISGTVAEGAAGSSPFAVTIELADDGTPPLVGTASFAWDIAVNRAPGANPDFYETEPGSTLTIGSPGVLFNDLDPDGDALSATVLVPPTAGTLAFSPAGGFTYIHNGGATVEDVFVYEADDGRGGLSLATVKISILEPNLPPTLTDDLLSILEDGVGSIAPLLNDSDPNGDPLTLIDFTQPEFGILSADADGTLTFTPPADFFGEVTSAYTAADGNGGVSSGVVTIAVAPVNDLPIGRRDIATLDSYLPFMLDVLSNDGDVDSDELRVTRVLGSAVGEIGVNSDGTLTYRPAAGFVGTDTFQYQVSDGAGGFDTVSVSITVPEEVLAVAIARGEDLGTPSLGFQAPDADLAEGPTLNIGLTQGVSLLADAFFQSLGALQLPILFLGLALGTVVVLGGFTELPMLLATRRRRFYSVVLLGREHRLAARAEADPDESAIYFYEPTAAGFQSLDKAVSRASGRWIPVESPNGAGWVEARYLTETVDLEFFLDDERPVAMLEHLAHDLVGRKDIASLFSSRGLALALSNDPEFFEPEAVQAAFADRDGSEDSIRLWETALEPLGAALRAAEDLDLRGSHSQAALIPIELWNFQYLTVNVAGHPPWLVYFEYDNGRPKIVGIGLDV